MWAANSMSGSPASDRDLIEWGGELGSDVSFFFSQGTAYCTGRGEVIDDDDANPESQTRNRRTPTTNLPEHQTTNAKRQTLNTKP